MTAGILRPCIGCGELIDCGSRCRECRPKDTRTGNRSHPYLHTARWERLSKRIRKRSPFCEMCGKTTTLTVDHIIPASERPDLIFVEENLRVVCATDNARRGTRCTDDERAQVLAAIAARKARTQRFYAQQAS